MAKFLAQPKKLVSGVIEISVQYVNAAMGNRKTCGIDPVTGEKLRWRYIDKSERN